MLVLQVVEDLGCKGGEGVGAGARGGNEGRQRGGPWG